MLKKERAGPTDNSGQLRRPSRSPRSQRSRSADVDCLKKYTERRVEERRHTEISDTSKLDTSRWMPLPKNVPRGQQSGMAKRPSRGERQESIDEAGEESEKWPVKPTSPTSAENRPSRVEREVIGRSQHTVRSHSTDVTALRKEKGITEQRRHTDCSDPRTIATRWLPQIDGAKFRRESSPLARIGCEITKSAASRWMTFAKSPSPGPVPRINERRDAERRDSVTEHGRKDESSRKDADTPKWQPPRKFSPVKNEKGRLQRQDELDIARDRSSSFVDANERANKLSERMRDLYDFKIETEWPKRAGTSRENTWISKSSSEEEKSNYPPVRRNSQDLEFNDRIDIFKSKPPREEEDRRRPKRSTHDASEAFANERDECLRKFNDKLRYSEDGTGGRIRRERRTYSDDYDEKVRRESRSSRPPEPFKRERPEAPAVRRLVDKENKRNSDVSMKPRDSQVSYVEIDFAKKDSRTSDASYASVSLAKRGSVECKSTQKILDVPPRRAFSQSDERPATPVPPIEFNDERYVPKKLSEPSKREGTRYKVYLT
ncbi:hypothetical protein P5V15_010032 [Pogonomyrmex californicus]